MPMDDRDQRFLRFARAIALVSGVAIPLGATMPACAEEQLPPTDAGLAVEQDARDGIAVDAPPPGLRIDDAPEVGGDAVAPDAALRDVPTVESTGGPMMPPEFDETLA